MMRVELCGKVCKRLITMKLCKFDGRGASLVLWALCCLIICTNQSQSNGPIVYIDSGASKSIWTAPDKSEDAANSIKLDNEQLLIRVTSQLCAQFPHKCRSGQFDPSDCVSFGFDHLRHRLVCLPRSVLGELDGVQARPSGATMERNSSITSAVDDELGHWDEPQASVHKFVDATRGATRSKRFSSHMIRSQQRLALADQRQQQQQQQQQQQLRAQQWRQRDMSQQIVAALPSAFATIDAIDLISAGVTDTTRLPLTSEPLAQQEAGARARVMPVTASSRRRTQRRNRSGDQQLLIVPKRTTTTTSAGASASRDLDGAPKSTTTTTTTMMASSTTTASSEREAAAAAAASLQCNMRQFTFTATKEDERGNKCSGPVAANICYGACDTGEIADWLFPGKKSIHKVCRHGARIRRRAELTNCTSADGADAELAPDEPVREYFYVDALDCVCKKCTSLDTACLGTMTQPYLTQAFPMDSAGSGGGGGGD